MRGSSPRVGHLRRFVFAAAYWCRLQVKAMACSTTASHAQVTQDDVFCIDVERVIGQTYAVAGAD